MAAADFQPQPTSLKQQAFASYLKTKMVDKVTQSLYTLPIELVYRILDNLDELTVLLLSAKDSIHTVDTIIRAVASIIGHFKSKTCRDKI
jgi:hypothetical protein